MPWKWFKSWLETWQTLKQNQRSLSYYFFVLCFFDCWKLWRIFLAKWYIKQANSSSANANIVTIHQVLFNSLFFMYRFVKWDKTRRNAILTSLSLMSLKRKTSQQHKSLSWLVKMPGSLPRTAKILLVHPTWWKTERSVWRPFLARTPSRDQRLAVSETWRWSRKNSQPQPRVCFESLQWISSMWSCAEWRWLRRKRELWSRAYSSDHWKKMTDLFHLAGLQLYISYWNINSSLTISRLWEERFHSRPCSNPDWPWHWLSSWARLFPLTVPLYTQVYKWVLANWMMWVTLQHTRIPSGAEYKYSWLLFNPATEAGDKRRRDGLLGLNTDFAPYLVTEMVTLMKAG